MRSRIVLFCNLFPAVVGLCAAGPPPPGVEATVAAGAGSFEYPSGGCGTALYANRATSVDSYAAATYRHETGLGGSVEVSASAARTIESRLIDPGEDENPPLADPDQLGTTRVTVSLAPRLAYHHPYFGVEAGVFVIDDFRGDFRPAVLPSATGWFGVPRLAYAWASFLAGPSSIAHLPVEAGIGHSSERVRATLGVGYEPSVVAAASYKLSPQVPLFVGGRITQLLPADRQGTLGAITLAYTW